MRRDSEKMRGEKPFIFTNIKQEQGIDEVIEWIVRYALMD